MSIFIPPSDPSLTMSASTVDVEDILSKEIQSIIDRMLDVIKGNQVDMGNGIMSGLAAPQIGIMKRIIIIDSGGVFVPYVNPEITWYSEEIVWGPEGCYSADDHLDGKVPRSKDIRMTAYDREGNLVKRTLSGFTARIFQHEVDHLEGIRFPDRISENGTLHWIPDNQYNQYLKSWEDWPLTVPFSLWLDIKYGRPYAPPFFNQTEKK